MALLARALLPAAAGMCLVAAARAAPLRCADEGSQLFPVNLEVLDAAGSVLYDSASGSGHADCRKICSQYPRGLEDWSDTQLLIAWRGFSNVATVQFVLPAAMASSAAAVRLLGGGGAPARFEAYHQDARWATANGSLMVTYPPADASAGDPVHLSVFKTGQDGEAEAEELMAVFVSFEQRPRAGIALDFDHHCKITSDIGPAGLINGSCSIGPPAWKCYGAGGSAWAAGQPVAFVNYEAGLANSDMAAGGKSVLIELADTADLSVPLSNSYAEHHVHDSPACRALCTSVGIDSSRRSLFRDQHAAGCKLAAPPAFRAKAGYGRIVLRGFGRVNGQEMMK